MKFLLLKLCLLMMGFGLGLYAQEAENKKTGEDAEREAKIQTGFGVFDSEIIFGMVSVRGESDSDTIHGGYGLDHKYRKFHNTFDSDIFYTSVDDNANTHIFSIDAKSRYSLSNDDYLFAQGYYEDDRFSGYAWYNFMTVGYGHIIHISKNMKLTAEASYGIRRTRIYRGKRERDYVGVGYLEYNWKIDEGVQFDEKITVVTGSNGTEYKFDTSLQTKIYENVSLKLQHLLQHYTEAPKGKSDTKTVTSVNLVYSF